MTNKKSCSQRWLKNLVLFPYRMFLSLLFPREKEFWVYSKVPSGERILNVLFCSLGRKNFERTLWFPREKELWAYSMVPSGERILSILYGSLGRKNFERTLWFPREKEFWTYLLYRILSTISSVSVGLTM
jgi:hypothetical protein